MNYYAFLISTILIDLSLGQIQVNPACDTYQYLAVGQTYYIYNPTYPGSFGQNERCRWISQAPPGYKVELICSDININQTPNCASDRLSVSLTGDPNFVNGQNYCGTGTLTLNSTTNFMSIGLFSTSNSPGGRVSCRIRAILNTSPPVTTQKPGGCDCGWRQQTRIVGGTETGINEFPFTAALINSLEKRLFCGATIIHYHYAITAAHCLNKITDVSKIGLLVGEHDYGRGTETNASTLYRLSGHKYHENYNPTTHQHDIGIVRTEVDMTFSRDVGPACLPMLWANTRPPVSSNVILLGWGTTEFTGPASKVLLGVEVSVVSNQYCQQEYGERIQIFPSQICTYRRDKDACQSDSGGPVVYLDNVSRRLHLVGVISHGVGCAMDYPGVNTRVTSYMDWIIRNTQDATYCRK